jgi:serine phosphatase RsbU (regulator of sigma subunit)
MKAKFDTEKKQKEIELLNKEKELQDSELKKQTLIRNSFIVGFALMILLSFLILRSYRIKKKANIQLALQKKEIEEKNEELHQQNEEISAQRDEIEAQRDLVFEQKSEIEKQHELLEEKNREVIDSIRYALRIQNAILPSEQTIKQIFSEYFILFKPRDIVSGDFYWATQINNFKIVAVGDCTGHGVPGAFMSLLGITFLNEIVRKNEVTQANHILNDLRLHVIEALQQTGAIGTQKDGMDISILVINNNELTKDNNSNIQWAGANNPLYIISSTKDKIISNKEEINHLVSSDDKFLYEIKADKMPVGIYHGEQNEFKNHILQINRNDMLYLFTDGIADQFGGSSGKKFMYKRFQQLLLNTADKNLPLQKQIIDKSLNDWMSNVEKGYNYSQLDDICLVGIRI